MLFVAYVWRNVTHKGHQARLVYITIFQDVSVLWILLQIERKRTWGQTHRETHPHNTKDKAKWLNRKWLDTSKTNEDFKSYWQTATFTKRYLAALRSGSNSLLAHFRQWNELIESFRKNRRNEKRWVKFLNPKISLCLLASDPITGHTRQGFWIVWVFLQPWQLVLMPTSR